MERVDVTIVGGGPVGLFGAFYAGMRGMSVRIVDSLPDLGGQLTALYPEKYVYDMPGFPAVLAKDLAASLIEQAMRFKPDLTLGETAESIQRDDEGWTIGTSGGMKLPTRTAIVSAGAGAFHPTPLGVEREAEMEGRGLSYGVRRLADFAGKRVVVVGGGDSAFDWAMNLRPVAQSVCIVHRRDQFRAHEETVQAVRDMGVPIHVWSVVRALIGQDRIEGVEIEDTQAKQTHLLPCDAVVVNVGFKSSLGPIKDWGMQIEKNQIVVDHNYRTSLPGVFAVGDVCSFEGKIKLIATGVGEAATAVCLAKTMIDPAAKLFPGHSSDMSQFAGQTAVHA